jgi:hypothetical protein
MHSKHEQLLLEILHSVPYFKIGPPWLRIPSVLVLWVFRISVPVTHTICFGTPNCPRFFSSQSSKTSLENNYGSPTAIIQPLTGRSRKGTGRRCLDWRVQSLKRTRNGYVKKNQSVNWVSVFVSKYSYYHHHFNLLAINYLVCLIVWWAKNFVF